MKLYPHWLDGELIRLMHQNGDPAVLIDARLTRWLKIHALLGSELVLSDVQVFDSPVVCRLFADDRFYDFIKKNRSFLDLRVAPDDSLGSSSFALAARGLARTRAPEWMSSVDGQNTVELRELAEEILTTIQRNGLIQESVMLKTEAKYSVKGERFKGIRKAVCYFGLHDNPTQMNSSVGAKHSYYSVLQESLTALREEAAANPRSTVLQQDLIRTHDAVTFVEGAIEEKSHRHLRSKAIIALNSIEDPVVRANIWTEIVQAWNLATERTLAVDGGSVTNIGNNPPPSSFLEHSFEDVTPVLQFSSSRTRALPTLEVDLDKISWSDISTALQSSQETLVKLRKLRGIRLDAEAYKDLLDRHFRSISLALRPQKHSSKTSYVLQCLSAAAGIVVPVALFGGSIAAVAAVGVAAKLALDVVASGWKDFGIDYVDRGNLSNTLRRSADEAIRNV